MCKNFVHFPGTRLGRLARAKSRKEILDYCDKYFPPEETEVGVPEFFFDHSWIGFNSIYSGDWEWTDRSDVGFLRWAPGGKFLTIFSELSPLPL